MIRCVLLLSAIISFGYAAVVYLDERATGEFVIEPRNYRIERIVAGTESTVTVKAINRSTAPVRVVGLSTC